MGSVRVLSPPGLALLPCPGSPTLSLRGWRDGMGVSQELWGTTILAEAQGPGAPLEGCPPPCPKLQNSKKWML